MYLYFQQPLAQLLLTKAEEVIEKNTAIINAINLARGDEQ